MERQLDFLSAQLLTRFGDDCAIFIGGSYLDVPDAPDLDLLVIRPELERPSAEKWLIDGVVCTAWVHDFDTLLYSIKSEASRGVGALLSLVCESRLIPPGSTLGNLVRSQCERVLKQGPPIPDASVVARQLITLRGDLRRERSATEKTAVSISVYLAFVSQFLATQGIWGGGDPKHFDRAMRINFPEIHQNLMSSLAKAVTDSDTTPMDAMLVGWMDLLKCSKPFPNIQWYDKSHRITSARREA